MTSSVIARTGVPSLAIFILLTVLAASFGASFQPGDWYAHLDKPPWTPPNAIFAPVWSALYLVIAIAGWRLWRATGRFVAPLQIWMAQLFLNALWSFLFFGIHRMDLAFVDIAVLLAAIAAFIVTARRHSAAASWLFVPYALWVAFAAALNFTVWQMNDGGFGG